MPDDDRRIVVMGVVTDILNDEDLDNLRVKDVRRLILHLQDRLRASEEMEESEEELRNYVL